MKPAWRIPLICLGIAACTWFVFGQTANHEFLNYDDPDYVTHNHHVAGGLTSHGFVWAFTHTHSANWHPITWLSHMVDCHIHGLRPRGHHLGNVLFHTANAILLFLLLFQLTAAMWRSAFVAVVFAVHPLRAESVAWIAERKDVLSGLLFLLTLWAYMRFTRRKSWLSYALALLFFSLGLMSKPMLVTTPLVLLLLDYWPLQRSTSRTRLLIEKLPFVVLSLLAATITILAQRGAIAAITHVPFSLRIENAAVSYLIYLRQLIWPVHLAPFYPFPHDGLSLTTSAAALISLCAISAIVYYGRRQRYLVTGWIWYLVMLLPVIGLVQVGEQSHADRYSYLSQIGLYFALTWAVADLVKGLLTMRIVATTASVALVVALSLAARAEAAYWHDSVALWQHALASTQDNATARKNLAHAYYERGQLAEAITNYERALVLDPQRAQVHSNLGVALLDLGRTDEAVSHFQAAIHLQPSYAEAHSNLGLVLIEKGKLDEAVAEFKEAIKDNPDLRDAHYNLGNAFLELHRLPESAAEYEQAIALHGHDERALNNLAWIRATSPDDSVRNAQEAIRLASKANRLTGRRNPVIAATLAAAYAEAGQFDQAITTAKGAIELSVEAGDMNRAAMIGEQLKLYEAGQAYREHR